MQTLKKNEKKENEKKILTNQVHRLRKSANEIWKKNDHLHICTINSFLHAADRFFQASTRDRKRQKEKQSTCRVFRVYSK